MSTPEEGIAGAVPAETVLLLNRATLVTQLVRSAIHELNNALLLISGSAEMLGSRADLPPEVRARLEKILAQTDRSSSVLRHVSTMARGDRLGPRLLNVAEAAADCVQQRRHQAVRLGISVTLDAASDDPLRVAVDPLHLQQMLLNLLLNAEHSAAAAAAPAIGVRIGRHGRWVETTVLDNGPGLDAAVQPDAIFDPFVTAAAPGEAAGLGLTAVRILAASYGGDVTYERSDEGTRVTVRLPAAS